MRALSRQKVFSSMQLLLPLFICSCDFAASFTGFKTLTSHRSTNAVFSSTWQLKSFTDQNRADEAPKLTPQERILQEVLNIEPETTSQKEERLLQRKELLNQSVNEKKKNIAVAALAVCAAILNYAWQFSHPITSLSLLTDMQNSSAEINVIGNNGKPTVVDFWAPWCGNCKSFAPTLAAIEKEYEGRVNFVMVNGDKGENWPIIERFGVDAIPHLAMVGSDGIVETALIGPIPRAVLREDMNAMLENSLRDTNADVGKKELPYVMFDAFRSTPELRQLKFPSGDPPIKLGKQN